MLKHADIRSFKFLCKKRLPDTKVHLILLIETTSDICVL